MHRARTRTRGKIYGLRQVRYERVPCADETFWHGLTVRCYGVGLQPLIFTSSEGQNFHYTTRGKCGVEGYTLIYRHGKN